MNLKTTIKAVWKNVLIAAFALVAMQVNGQESAGEDWISGNMMRATLPEDTKSRLDSVVKKDHNADPLERIVYVYDGEDRILSSVRQSYNSIIAQYTNAERYTYEYGTDGNVSARDYSKWNATTKAWDNQERTEEDFNRMGKKTSQRNYAWEAGAWKLVSRGDATYDENGNELTNIVKQYSSYTQGWIKSKNEYTYNERNLTTSITFYGSVPEEQDFVPSFRTLYDYDDKDNLTRRQSEDWDVTKETYYVSMKETWTYDEKSNVLTWIISSLNYDTGVLKETSKHENTYDQRGNLMTHLFYNKDSEEKWQVSMKDDYTYNSMDSVLTKISYSVPYGSTELAPDSKQKYTYDEAGNKTESLFLYMDESGSWANMSKEERTYDANRNMLMQRKYSWEMALSNDGEWQQTFNGVYSYDAERRLTAIEEQRYDAMQGVWIGLQKSETSYDKDGNILEERIYQWVEEMSVFALAGTITYYYSATSAITGGAAAEKRYKIYSADGTIYAVADGNRAAFTVYTLDGQKVFADVKSALLPKGALYVVVVEGRRTFKIMVR